MGATRTESDAKDTASASTETRQTSWNTARSPAAETSPEPKRSASRVGREVSPNQTRSSMPPLSTKRSE